MSKFSLIFCISVVESLKQQVAVMLPFLALFVEAALELMFSEGCFTPRIGEGSSAAELKEASNRLPPVKGAAV